MKAEPIFSGEWRELTKITNALCSDGKRRTARVYKEATDPFSRPAKVKVKGTEVTGYVIVDGDDWFFCAEPWRKNSYLLPSITLEEYQRFIDENQNS